MGSGLTSLRREAQEMTEKYEELVQYYLSHGLVIVQCPSCPNAFTVPPEEAHPGREWRCPCGARNLPVRRA